MIAVLKWEYLDPEKSLTIDEIVKSEDCFFVATGITDGMLMRGIRKTQWFNPSHSFVTIENEEKSNSEAVYLSKNYQFVEAFH